MTRMDKLILIFVITFAIVLNATLCIELKRARAQEQSGNLYAIPANVSTIDDMRGRIGVTDSRKIEWYWYEESKWKLNDMVILVMNDHGTEYLYDDYIVSISETELMYSEP